MRDNIDPNWLGEDDIYKENILDHYKNPRNLGEIQDADIKHTGLNPVCGDTIRLFVKLKDNKITEAKFKGQGCAISIASASMLTEKIIGKKLDEVKKLTTEEIKEMLGIELGIVRVKCGLLSLNTLFRGIEIMEEENELLS